MILKQIRNVLALGALSLHLLASGQSSGTYSLGADVNICQGQTTTLTAPAGCTSYAWNTGPVTQSITVGAGNYSCTVVKPTGQLIVNGDFTAGNSGFSSQFNYNTDLIPEPNYFVDNNTVTHHNNFFATGNGNFLMANAGPNDNNRIVWQQTVPVRVAARIAGGAAGRGTRCCRARRRRWRR